MGLLVLLLMRSRRTFSFIKKVCLILLRAIRQLIMLWLQLGMIINQRMEVNHILSLEILGGQLGENKGI